LDVLNIVLIVSVSVILYFLVQKLLLSNKKEIKPTAVKKEELIMGFELRMRKTIETYHGNAEMLKTQKMKTLKEISAELSTNIFFDKQEVKELIQKLANMH